MPNYTAYCTACESEQEFFSAMSRYKERLRELRCCGGAEMRIRIYPVASRTAFAAGKYDIGVSDGPVHFDTEKQMHKAVDDYNRKAAERGSDGIRLRKGL